MTSRLHHCVGVTILLLCAQQLSAQNRVSSPEARLAGTWEWCLTPPVDWTAGSGVIEFWCGTITFGSDTLCGRPSATYSVAAAAPRAKRGRPDTAHVWYTAFSGGGDSLEFQFGGRHASRRNASSATEVCQVWSDDGSLVGDGWVVADTGSGYWTTASYDAGEKRGTFQMHRRHS
jgi:hypothetical protein